ncbi:MAG TPA: hypothetical protein VGK67_37860 [Myxococcales bacterium]|jgi:hypothetical protein
MNAKLLGLVVGASLVLSACLPEVSKLSCGKKDDCAANAYCDISGGQGVCVSCQATETSCSDGNDNDCDGKVDCLDEDCQAAACRPAMGPCDEPEFCAAGQQECPADLAVVKDTVCREETACGPKGICDGKSAACPGAATADSKGATCRAETACGKAATCDGASPECPPLELKEKGTVCGDVGGGPCVSGGTCDGVSTECPALQILPSTELCPGLKPCEQARFCTGTSGACASDVAAPKRAGVVCRESAGACDPAESCDGVQLDCSEDLKAPATEICRAAAEVSCEKDAYCDGVGAACPAPAPREVGAVCRPAAGDCDVPETCSGTDLACPADAVKAADVAVPCRPSLGKCDPDEFCDGVGPACPAEVILQAGTVCRESAGACDPKETCDGTLPECPGDARLPAGTKCAESGGPCEEPGYCLEGVAQCPLPKLKEAGLVCLHGGGCGFDSLCDGTSKACPALELKPVGTVCGLTPADPCTLPQSCDVSGKCLPVSYLPAAEQCGLTSLERCASTTVNTTATTCPMPTASIASPSGWTWENPLPQGNGLNGVASTALARYFVGDAGTALRYDGNAFTRMSVLDGNSGHFRGALRGICIEPISNAVWVVGDQGYIGKHSPLDLANGFKQTSANTLSGVTFRAVWCEGGGKLVAVGNSGSNGVVYRGDGVAMTLETTPSTGHLSAVWGTSYTDLWAVGAAGTVLNRDANGKWNLLTCPNASTLHLNGVGGVGVTAGGTPSDVWISGRTTDYTKPLPGVYRVKRAVQPFECEAYPDPDGHPPEGLTGISVTGADAAWAVNGAGEALEMRQGSWSEPVPVGVARELYAVEANLLGGVAVAGQAGALSVRTSVGMGKWRWLPSRSVTFYPLNAAWTGVVDGVEESAVVGKHGTLLRRTPEGQWAQPAALATTFRDDLYAIANAAGDVGVWVGGYDPATTEGVVHNLDSSGIAETYRLAGGAPITSVGVNDTHLTVAAKLPYQLVRGGGVGLSQQASEQATVVSSAPSGAQAYFAGQKVYSLTGAASGTGQGQVAELSSFLSGTYVGLQAVPDVDLGVTALYGAVAERKAYYLANVNGANGALATEYPLNASPLALRVVSAGKFWVVGSGGLAKLIGATIDPGDWAGTSWSLRGVAVSPDGHAIAVGEQGAILRRLSVPGSD